MPLADALLRLLHGPTPEALWQLRGDVLEAGVPADDRVWTVIGAFRAFLDRLSTNSSSRAYSDLASKMDISALGGVVIEEAMAAADARELAQRMLTGVITEGLAVLATRQHVKAWEGELSAVYRDATWFLYEELWRWAALRRPELAPGDRRRLLDGLLAPLTDPGTAGEVKAVVIGRLFQLLIADALSRALAR
ncbi:MAG: hypothetical protein ACM3O7_05515 [Acidobacteriota bacterium]